MIDPAHRRALLAHFPHGTPLAIVAPAGAYDGLAAQRGDPALALFDLVAPPAAQNLIFEGLDAFVDPSPLLRELRAAAPGGRLFVLVANGAHLPALVAYFGGAAIAPARPLVRDEIAPLLAAGGWRLLALEPVDGVMQLQWCAPPAAMAIGNLRFDIPDDATLQRVRPAGYLAVAEPS